MTSELIHKIREINPTIIAFGHKAHVGKDLAAHYVLEYFQAEMKEPAIVISFAEPIKAACELLFHLNEEQMNGKLKEVKDEFWGLSPRQLFQQFGTLIRQWIGDDAFVRIFLQKVYEAAKNGTKHIINPDCRFPIEADVLQKLHARLVDIERNAADSVCEHHSETALDHYKHWTATITNNGTKEQFRTQLIQTLQL
jgi:hypothetical protein